MNRHDAFAATAAATMLASAPQDRATITAPYSTRREAGAEDRRPTRDGGSGPMLRERERHGGMPQPAGWHGPRDLEAADA
jgi:hypothetical protein